MKDILTEEDYLKILQSKLEVKGIQFISSEWKSLDCVEGYMGDHYFLKINYKLNNEEKSEKFFLKTKPTKTEIQRDLASKFNVYDKEIFLYSYLMKEFKRLGYPINFAPKSYYCVNGETIVMEDLQLRNFTLFNRNNFFDLEHCKMALKSLANYHANCYSYEEEKTKELGRPYQICEGRDELFSENFFIPDDKEGAGYKFIKSTKDCYIELIKTMPVSKEWRKSFEDRILDFDVPKIFWQVIPSRKTVGHGDLWSNNMMFRYENESPKECCLLDFQLLRYHHPSFDAALVIYSNTGRDFRKKHMKELLDYYYESFEAILKQNGFHASDILPKANFLKVADVLKSVALLQGACTRTFTQLPKEILSDAVNSGGNDLENLFFEDERTRLIIEACKKDEEFKNIMFDDIYDLNECI